MTDYIATQKITGGTYDGMALSEAHPPITADSSRIDFTWTLPDDLGTFADLGIVGFKLVGQFTGSGVLEWTWEADNPGYPGSPEWPIDSGYSHLTLAASVPSVATVAVDGPTAFEWVFALTDTASDPTYNGLSYLDPLHDVEISLHATATSTGFDHTAGTISSGSSGTDVQVLRWDLVLFAADNVTRLWPRDDALGLGTANRLVPAPRAGRIIGRQP